MIATVIIALVLIAVGGPLAYLWRQYAPATVNPEAEITLRRSERVNMPRRHREPLSAWNARVSAGWDELLAASDEFIEAAQHSGWYEQLGSRAGAWHLPENHPAAVRYAKARGLEPTRSHPYRAS